MDKKIVTLHTDFGTRDGNAGCIKGVLKSYYPDVEIIIATQIQSGRTDVVGQEGIASDLRLATEFFSENNKSAELLDQYSGVSIKTYQEANGDVYLFDGIHPNDQGGVLIGDHNGLEMLRINDYVFNNRQP